jgi:hypothetical protein
VSENTPDKVGGFNSRFKKPSGGNNLPISIAWDRVIKSYYWLNPDPMNTIETSEELQEVYNWLVNNLNHYQIKSKFDTNYQTIIIKESTKTIKSYEVDWIRMLAGME